jgi:Leucine-rich repeat (LRR) protein
VSRLDESIGLMDNLTLLYVTIKTSSEIPSELGDLINLTYLRLEQGFDGCIPSELGNLHGLAYLGINSSRVVSVIPTELGQLTNLSVLSFKQNKSLTCKLPKEFNQLKSLKTINLSGSHGVHHQNVMTRGSWTRNVWKDTLPN